MTHSQLVRYLSLTHSPLFLCGKTVLPLGAEQLNQEDEVELEDELNALLAEAAAPKVTQTSAQTSEMDELILAMERTSLAIKNLPPPQAVQGEKGKERKRETEDALLAN